MMDIDSNQYLRPVGAFALGLGTLWVIGSLIRQTLKSVFPQGVPGELNTALLASPRPPTSTKPSAKDLEDVVEYDYIIIGTGTAGCVLANRLTADPKTRVLTIEAGQSDLKQLFSRIPIALPQLFRTTADWAYSTTPQPDCENRELEWPRGKMIGGCSSINAMMYTKGAPEDYDEWERLGNKGWGYKDVAPYMKKSETFTQPADPKRKITSEDLSQHGRSGPWQIGYTAQAEITQMFPDACNDVGIKKTTDINTDRGMLGASPTQTFIDQQGQRSSTAVAYFTADVVARPNLRIASGQNVTRIIFDTSGREPRAVGVEMTSSKLSPIRYLAKATKEVILCAGSVGTPQLLKVSGIGPADELKSLRIPIVKELSGVGENLSDHLVYHGAVFKTDKKVSFHYLQFMAKTLPDLYQWFRTGTGNMTSQACDSFAFVRTADRDDAPPHLKQHDLTSGPTGPDLEFMALSLCFTQNGRFIAPYTHGYGTVATILLRPESRGTIKLVSDDVFDAPLINPKALSSEHDMDVMLYGAKLAARIAKADTYKKYFKGWYMGPHHQVDWDTASDEHIKDRIRKTVETVYHPMGTAKMGNGSDAVVDDQLRVHGVKGLRVVDASIFPTPLACHTCAPVVMVAEKAADLIIGAA